MVVTVEDGVVVKITGDKDNPASSGYLCSKGAAMVEVQRDPDRITHPLRRTGAPGVFERCTWDEAMDDIVARLQRIIAEHGRDSVGAYLGNPAGMHTGHMYWLTGFLAALGSPHLYSPGSQDTNTRLVASHYLYGNPITIPFPDVGRTDFLLIFGGNPLVSKGSLLTMPRPARASRSDRRQGRPRRRDRPASQRDRQGVRARGGSRRHRCVAPPRPDP